MDTVYVNRDGDNPELRYSLRTLENVEHDRVWIFGGAPSWINEGTVEFRKRVQGGTPYSSTRGHIMAACNTAEVSDPFVLWNDDFYAMHHVGTVPIYHRGSMEALLGRSATLKTPWGKGLRETAALMEKHGMLAGAMSYDVHLPLIIYKTEMREALRLAKAVRTDAVHLRSLYGAIAGLGGVEHPDPKMMRRSDPFPSGAWLSSGNDTFRSTVEPVLRYLFPDKSPYEKE
jgi:hypothetical protein